MNPYLNAWIFAVSIWLGLQILVLVARRGETDFTIFPFGAKLTLVIDVLLWIWLVHVWR